MKKAGVLSILFVVVLLAFAVIAEAQQPAREVPRIGILFIGDRNQPHLEAFKQGLRERGYIEGQKYRYRVSLCRGQYKSPSFARG